MSTFPRQSGRSLLATPTGVSVATSSSAHTKGSWAQVTAGYEYAVAELQLGLQLSSDADPQTVLLDVGLGGAGSESVVIANLAFKRGGYAGNTPSIALPYAIPAGKRVAIRAQHILSGTYTPNAFVAPIFASPLALAGAGVCTTLGITEASTTGTAVGFGSSTFGTPVQFSSALVHAVRYIVVSMLTNSDGYGGIMGKFSTDSGGSDVVGVPFFLSMQGSDSSMSFGPVLVPCAVPAGKALYVSLNALGSDFGNTASLGLHCFG